MSSVETVADGVGQKIEEINQEIGPLAVSTKLPLGAAALEFQEHAAQVVDQVKGVVTSALDDLRHSGSTDQLLGYANEAIGQTKLAVGLVAQSPDIVVAGIAQKSLGELQKFVGEAKLAAEEIEKPEEHENREA